MNICSICSEPTTFFWVSKNIWVHPLCNLSSKKPVVSVIVKNPLECEHGFEAEIMCPTCRIEKGLVVPKPLKTPSKPSIDRNTVRVGTSAPSTSLRAAAKALPSSGTKRRLIYDAMVAAGDEGLCDHELEQMFGWVHQSASAARNSLMNDGWCVVSNKQRLTPQMNMANAYIAIKLVKCFVTECSDHATDKYFGKDLCQYHHSLTEKD